MSSTPPPKLAAIIPAAGTGSRYRSSGSGGSDIPKIFELLVGGDSLDKSSVRTVFQCALASVLSSSLVSECVIPTRKELVSELERQAKAVCEEYGVPFRIVLGGASRQESVYLALSQISEDFQYVLVHDAARPCCSLSSVRLVIEAALRPGVEAAILGVPARDTLKRVNGNGQVQETVEREGVYCVQTPQVFSRELLFRAHESARAEDFFGTDDSSLFERLGERVLVVDGESSNIKLTENFDLQLLRTFLNQGLS